MDTLTTLLLDDAGAALMEGLLIDCLIDAAVSLDKLDRKKDPVSYPEERLRLCTAAIVLAKLIQPKRTAMPEDALMTFPIPPWLRSKGDPQGFDHQMRDAVTREGIDPNKEFGHFDPRASEPKCVHGVLFTEECTDCDPPANTMPTNTTCWPSDENKIRANDDLA